MNRRDFLAGATAVSLAGAQTNSVSAFWPMLLVRVIFSNALRFGGRSVATRLTGTALSTGVRSSVRTSFGRGVFGGAAAVAADTAVAHASNLQSRNPGLYGRLRDRMTDYAIGELIDAGVGILINEGKPEPLACTIKNLEYKNVIISQFVPKFTIVDHENNQQTSLEELISYNLTILEQDISVANLFVSRLPFQGLMSIQLDNLGTAEPESIYVV